MFAALLSLAGTVWAEPVATPKGPTKALRGDLIIVQGQRIHLAGLECPPFSTEEGREAKMLVTTMLRAPLVECVTREMVTGATEGDCFFRRNKLVRARSMVSELKSRNLCLRYGRA